VTVTERTTVVGRESMMGDAEGSAPAWVRGWSARSWRSGLTRCFGIRGRLGVVGGAAAAPAPASVTLERGYIETGTTCDAFVSEQERLGSVAGGCLVDGCAAA